MKCETSVAFNVVTSQCSMMLLLMGRLEAAPTNA
jgi:hypothetical protein